MAEAPQNEFKPDEAVNFLANFGHDPEAFKGKKPEEIQPLYEKANTFISSQIEAKLKDRGAFSDTWRQAIAGEDQEALKTLERFADPGALFKSYAELRKARDSGQLKTITPFPKDGKPEEQEAWRKENGIPAKPEEYKVELGDGLQIGEEDKPMVDSFLKTAHGLNLSPEAVNQTLKWYYAEHMPQMQRVQAEMDGEFRQQSNAKLREIWGENFKKNMNIVTSITQMFPESLRARFWGGRLADGRAVGDDPELIQALAQIGTMINPSGTLTGTGAEGGLKGINDRIAELDNMMKTNRSAWNKDKAAQDEYQQLVDARERLKKA